MGKGVFIVWRVSYFVFDLRVEKLGGKLVEMLRICGEDRMFYKDFFYEISKWRIVFFYSKIWRRIEREIMMFEWFIDFSFCLMNY